MILSRLKVTIFLLQNLSLKNLTESSVQKRSLTKEVCTWAKFLKYFFFYNKVPKPTRMGKALLLKWRCSDWIIFQRRIIGKVFLGQTQWIILPRRNGQWKTELWAGNLLLPWVSVCGWIQRQFIPSKRKNYKEKFYPVRRFCWRSHLIRQTLVEIKWRNLHLHRVIQLTNGNAWKR